MPKLTLRFFQALLAIAINLALLLTLNLVTTYAQNGTPVGGTIDQDTTWRQSDSPYVFSTTVTINTDASLTIEPGTIIKAGSNQRLVVRGAFTAVGTASEPIIFTSIKDDTVAGDTNGDGAVTAPAPNNWGGILGTGASTIQLEYATIRYSAVGISALSNLSLHDSLVEWSSQHAVDVSATNIQSTTISIVRSTFRDNGTSSTSNANLVVAGQPATLTIQDNSFVTPSYHSIELSDVSVAQISGNQITHNGTSKSYSHAIYLENVTEQVELINNIVTGNDESDAAGIKVRNGAPTLTNNTVTNFHTALLINGGYPTTIPILDNNNFDGNRTIGIGVSGDLETGTWINGDGNGYFLYESVILGAGLTLTITAGTIVKSLSGGFVLEPRSTLNSIGTAAAPIIFTDIKDDTVGGDTNGDGLATTPTTWASYGIIGNANGNIGSLDSSNLNLQHVTIRYAGTGIRAHGNLILQDSSIEYSNSDAVLVDPATNESPTILIERTTFRATNQGTGSASISVDGGDSQPESLTIQNNIFVEGDRGALSIRDINSALISSNEITQSTNRITAIALYNVTAQVELRGNTIVGTDNPTREGIYVDEGTPKLSNNSVSGFRFAVEVNDGYPQTQPTYINNNFENNTFTGIAVAGNINEGTWVNSGGYLHFIHGTVTIEDGATVAIPAGMVIKSVGGSLTLGQRARLNAIGTATEPIVFTSGYDDTVGGDNSNDVAVTQPTSKDWSGIRGQGSSNADDNASTLNMQYATVRYATIGITTNTGDVMLANSIIEHCSQSAISINGTTGEELTVSVSQTTIRENSSGIELNRMPTTLKLTDNAIYDNSSTGLNNRLTEEVDATGIWWGNATGPADAEGNPTGLGDQVTGNVNYSSWLTVVPAYVVASPGDDEPTATPTPTVVPTATLIPTAMPTVTPAVTPTATPTTSGPVPPPIATLPNIPTSADSFEGDNECTIATTIATDGSNQEHNFDKQGDRDWLKFEATAGQAYRVEVQSRANSVADVILEVYDACDGEITDTFEETFTPGVRLDLNPTQSGTFYLNLRNYDANIFGADAEYSVSVRHLKMTTGAVILLEGRLKQSDRLQANIHNVVQRTYDLFKASGYTDDNIHYLTIDTSSAGYDDLATAANLRNAITSWAAERVGEDAPLTIYLMDHGNIDKLYLDEPNGERITPSELNDWLTELEQKKPGVKTTIIVEACHSGSFIAGEQSISKAGRLVITSTNVQNVAFASSDGAQFSDRFLTSLQEGYGLSNSFWDARNSVRRLYKIQDPWIDTNGNGIPNEPEDGGEAISQHDPGTSNQPADTWAPYIVRAEAPASIEDGVGTIRAEVRDNKGVARVWAAIYGPSYRAPESVEELVPEDVPTTTFGSDGSDIFSIDYDGFTENGTYQIALYAEDTDGLKARLMVLDVENSDSNTSLYLPLFHQ